jgi:hypothetical protein
MSSKIDYFEINSYGELKLRTNGSHQVEHTYYGVPTSVIRKFINAKNVPELTDVNKWIEAAKEKKESKYADKSISLHSDFWNSDDD